MRSRPSPASSACSAGACLRARAGAYVRQTSDYTWPEGASGGEATALDGAPALATLVRTVAACGYPLTIVAGGGVRARNARRIVEATGVRELHLSGRSSAPSPMVHRSGLTLNAAYGASDYTRTVADAHLLRACRAAAAADV
jgi:copper homeostasis protein CutC